MNQLELKANTRNRRQARENACEQVAIGHGFASAWLRKSGASFFNQSQSVEKQSQLKTALYNTEIAIANMCIIKDSIENVFII